MTVSISRTPRLSMSARMVSTAGVACGFGDVESLLLLHAARPAIAGAITASVMRRRCGRMEGDEVGTIRTCLVVDHYRSYRVTTRRAPVISADSPITSGVLSAP